MKAITFSLGFVALIFLFIAGSCKKEKSEEPPDTVSEMDADSASYEYCTWYDTNLHAAIFGSGPSVFTFLNNPGTVNDDLDYYQGDTAVTASRRFLDSDSSRIFAFETFQGRFPKSGEDRFFKIGTAIAGNGDTTMRFLGAYCRLNGYPDGTGDIVVTNNQVSFSGEIFNVDQPEPFGPPSLASLLYQSKFHPPARPSNAQIDALPCGEIVGCYWSKEIHVFISKNYQWTRNNNSYHREVIIDFGFSHYWYYECPDGPLVRRIFVSVSISEKEWFNGTLYYSRRSEAYFLSGVLQY